FEEIFEQWTWALLGFHAKPCGFVNVNGYYEPMRASIQQMADKGFLAQQYVDMLIYADATAPALDAFRAYVPPPPKWGVAPVEQRY
ncbi:MAG: LOG family protein, partial [Phenylobacterium sp.]